MVLPYQTSACALHDQLIDGDPGSLISVPGAPRGQPLAGYVQGAAVPWPQSGDSKQADHAREAMTINLHVQNQMHICFCTHTCAHAMCSLSPGQLRRRQVDDVQAHGS